MLSKFTTLIHARSHVGGCSGCSRRRSGARRRGCDSNRWIRIATASSRAPSGAAPTARFKIQDWNGDGRLSGQRGPHRRPARRELRGGRPRAESVRALCQLDARPASTTSTTTAIAESRANEWHFDHRDVPACRPQSRRRPQTRPSSSGGDIDDARDDSFDDLDWNNNGRVERSRMEWQRRGVHEPRSQPRRRAEPFRGGRRREHAERHVGSSSHRWTTTATDAIAPRRVALVGRVVQSARCEPRRQCSRGRSSRHGGRRARRSRHIGWRRSSARCASTLNSAGPTRASSCAPADTLTLDASGTIQMSDDAQRHGESRPDRPRAAARPMLPC